MRILLFQLWAAIGFSKPSKSTDQFSNIDKFILCDLNRDQRIDKQEFQDCTTFPSLTNHQQAIEEIYTHFDVDHDSHLSKHEFSLYFNVLTDHERKVEIITADGKKKTVTQGEFLKMEEEKRKGFKYENGQVSKVNEGSLNLDQIKEENPDLSRFITLGQWAHHQITRLGYATGNIAGLKSIDDFDQRGESFRDNYLEMKFEITIKESSKTTQNVTFEVLLTYDLS